MRTDSLYCFFVLNSDSSCDLTGTKATGANVHSARSAVDDSLNSFNIGLPGSVGTSVGVGNLNTELEFLVADLAFCHWSAPPLIIGVNPLLNQR